MNSKFSFNLRKFNKNDVDSLAKYANNPNIAKFLTSEFPSPYSKEDAEFFIDVIENENPINTFAIEINGEVAGSIAINPQIDTNKNISYSNKNQNSSNSDTKIDICDKQGELGYWLAEKYWDNGIMTLAIKKMVNYGFKTFNIDCIFATPFKSNIISQKVLKKAGFKSNLIVRNIIKNNENYEVYIFSIAKK